MAGNLHHSDSTNTKLQTSVIEIRDWKTLSNFIPAWEELAAVAIEPNVFYEHWMLLPALEAFGAGKNINVVLVLIHDPRKPDVPAKLGGLFPLEPNHRLGKLKVLSLWQHVHCYVCTPLVRADAARECMSALFNWVRFGGANASLIQLKCISGDGPFHKMLVDLSNKLGLVSWTTEIFTRGLWRKTYDQNTDSELTLSSGLRRTLRRKGRRLRERGLLEHIVLKPGDDIGRWIDEFLRIEASGWKGQHGSALACSENESRYFTRIATAAFHRGRLLMLGINFDGRPIARRCAFVAGAGSFAFKTAYDEKFADFSPGTMLEIDNIRQLHALPGARWMDSCADASNGLVNRLTNDRRTIQSLSIGSNAWGELIVAGLPLLQWTHRRILNRPAATTPPGSAVKAPDSSRASWNNRK